MDYEYVKSWFLLQGQKDILKKSQHNKVINISIYPQ